MTGYQDENNKYWLTLDNAAKIYPAITNGELTSVFRVSVELKDIINIKKFLEAVNEIENRFPYYKVKLKKGVFWYYLETVEAPITVLPDKGTTCKAFIKDEILFRILVKRRTISLEFSHILTDASGAYEVLKSLLITYFRKCDVKVDNNIAYYYPSSLPDKEEFEDAYVKYFQKIQTHKVKTQKAFHLPYSLKATPRFSYIIAVIPIEDVMKKAKEYEVSITEYLIAVYLFSLQMIYREQTPLKQKLSSKFIQVLVPVNLRKKFSSKTMRNFSLFVFPGIDLRLGYYTFDEIVKNVYHQMQLQTEKKLIGKMISRNVGGEKKLMVRGMPLFIKSIFLSRIFTYNINRYSGVLTNFGKVGIDPTLNHLIDKFIFVPPPPNKKVKVNCAIVGFNKELVLTFGNITNSKGLEQKFFSFLTTKGIKVKLYKQSKNIDYEDL